MNQTPNVKMCPHCNQPNSLNQSWCWSCTKSLAGATPAHLSGPINPSQGIMVNGRLWQTGGTPQIAPPYPPPPIIDVQIKRRIPTAWIVGGIAALAFGCGFGFPIAMAYRSEMEFRGRMAEGLNAAAKEAEREEAARKALQPREVTRNQAARAAVPGKSVDDLIQNIGHPSHREYFELPRVPGELVPTMGEIWRYRTDQGPVYVGISGQQIVLGWSDRADAWSFN